MKTVKHVGNEMFTSIISYYLAIMTPKIIELDIWNFCKISTTLLYRLYKFQKQI